MSTQQFLSSIRGKLSTALLSDTLDHLGVRDRVLHESLRPVGLTGVMAGIAFTMHYIDIHQAVDLPYELEIEALDKVQPDNVVVACSNDSRNTGVWGDLLSTATRARGGVGAVTDGLIRDTAKIIDMGFPVYSAGFKPLDSSGRSVVYQYQTTVRVGGVIIAPGDIIVGDIDGIIAIPADLSKQAVEIALERAEKEGHTRDELAQGRLLREVYEKYGVL